MTKFSKFILFAAFLILSVIALLAYNVYNAKRKFDKDHPEYFTKEETLPKFFCSNQSEYPDIVFSNFEEKYDQWKGKYTLHFDVLNNSKSDYKFLYVQTGIYLNGTQVSSPFTGQQLKKGERATMVVNDIIPQRPERVVFYINKQNTELLGSID